MATKKCPHCAEKIQAEAKICRFCNFAFPEKPPKPEPTPSEQMIGAGCTILILAGLFILLSKGCSSNAPNTPIAVKTPDTLDIQYAAEQHLKDGLRDADSAKFRGQFVSRVEGGGMALCGEVNAKNSFGGYVGFRRFIASPNEAAPTLIEGEATGMGSDFDRKLFPEAYQRFCSSPVQSSN